MSETSRPTLRVRLDLAYDGTDFSGWAEQPGLRTVEGTLSAALATVLRLAEPATPHGRRPHGCRRARARAGRAPRRPADAWAAVPGRSDRAPGCRARLAPGRGAARTTSSCGGPARPPGLRRALRRSRAALPLPHRRRRRATRPAAAARHRVVAPSPRPRRHGRGGPARSWACATSRPSAGGARGRRPPGPCSSSRGTRLDDGVLAATVRADAFCHSMVRSLVGAVVPVGEGRRDADWPLALQRQAVRATEIHVMPPHGLSLEEVRYPPDDALGDARPRRPVAPRARVICRSADAAAGGPPRAHLTARRRRRGLGAGGRSTHAGTLVGVASAGARWSRSTLLTVALVLTGCSTGAHADLDASAEHLGRERRRDAPRRRRPRHGRGGERRRAGRSGDFGVVPPEAWAEATDRAGDVPGLDLVLALVAQGRRLQQQPRRADLGRRRRRPRGRDRQGPRADGRGRAHRSPRRPTSRSAGATARGFQTAFEQQGVQVVARSYGLTRGGKVYLLTLSSSQQDAEHAMTELDEILASWTWS